MKAIVTVIGKDQVGIIAAVCALLSVTLLRPILTYVFCYPVENMFPGNNIAVLAPWIAFLIDSVIRDRLMARRVRQGRWLEVKLN